jgi:hypothetical protein
VWSGRGGLSPCGPARLTCVSKSTTPAGEWQVSALAFVHPPQRTGFFPPSAPQLIAPSVMGVKRALVIRVDAIPTL